MTFLNSNRLNEISKICFSNEIFIIKLLILFQNPKFYEGIQRLSYFIIQHCTLQLKKEILKLLKYY